MLAGTQSVFHLDEVDDAIVQRLIDKDVDITAPMWGAGELMTSDNPKKLEQEISEKYGEFCEGLPRFGLKQERRRIRLIIQEAAIEVLANEQENDNELPSVKICFTLAAGSYATTVLRELIDYEDGTQRVQS
jgi:tRNA pseudouridine13 synthase